MAALYDPVAPHQSPDLAAFKRRGGKLIVYHGWADQGVSPAGHSRLLCESDGEGGRHHRRAILVPRVHGAGHVSLPWRDAPNTFDFMPGIVAWVEKSQALTE